ncbi:MAG: T9SS type A sorting domain-containing protein [Bacteroidetes bacterium]|nr:T9SS type A sorting domain-containing protein [Bacteroidota bacterium]
MSRRIVNNKQEINLQSFENGVYLYQIIKNETEVIKKDKLIVN